MGENGQKSLLTAEAERISALNNPGFEWVVGTGTGRPDGSVELREFHQTHGHCRVPQRYPLSP